jgi:hypothetical protein
MQGVQILNEFMYEGAVVAPWFGVGLSCCIGGIIGTFIFSSIVKIPQKIRCCISVIMLCIFGFGIGVGAFAPREMTPRYQVTIDDGVEFNDFTSKYKIIKQDGLIYTVEERECNIG